MSKEKEKQTNAPISLDITKFTFVRDQLLVRAIRPAGKGKLVDIAQYEDKPEFGEVIKAGNEAVYIKIGQIIRFGKYSSEAIRTNGEDYFIIHEEDVSAYL